MQACDIIEGLRNSRRKENEKILDSDTIVGSVRVIVLDA
jgi:hypothetical protein